MVEKTYRIGEVASMLGLKSYVLRFWETEFSQIDPLRTDKGQRVYTESHVALLKRIKYLLHEKGMTIEGARRMLRMAKSPHWEDPLGEELGLDKEQKEQIHAQVLALQAQVKAMQADDGDVPTQAALPNVLPKIKAQPKIIKKSPKILRIRLSDDVVPQSQQSEDTQLLTGKQNTPTDQSHLVPMPTAERWNETHEFLESVRKELQHMRTMLYGLTRPSLLD